MILPTLCFRVALHEYLFVAGQPLRVRAANQFYVVATEGTRERLIALLTPAERVHLAAFEAQEKGQPT